jgi:MFS family permease
MMWSAPLLMRLHGMSVAEAGLWLGPITGLAGALGVLAGGRLADRLGRRDARWYVRLPALSTVIGLPFTIGFILSEDVWIALLCLVPHQIMGSMVSGPIAAVMQAIVPVRMRALAVAVSLLVVNLIGLGLGPQLVGVLSDLLRDDLGDRSLRVGMLVAGVANLLGGALYLAAGRWIRR